MTVLEKYMRFIMGSSPLVWRPPADGVYVNRNGLGDGSTEAPVMSMILDRDDRLQTELFIIGPSVKPGRIVSAHVHPEVDSIEVPLIGKDFTFFADGIDYVHNTNGQAIRENNFVRVPTDCVHGARSDNAISFLSFQHWLGDGPVTSVGLNWEYA